jgi:hypothetical protein
MHESDIMEQAVLDAKEIIRLEQRGIRLAENRGEGTVADNEDQPLKGVIHKQRARNSNVKDMLNIGSGTRCTNCGLLYFCWAENCSACGKQMEFNLGHRDEGARL